MSVVINTFNEENNIRNCLECVKWADEIIIVDMYSDDATVKIAQEYTNHIFMHKRMGYADPARQFALEKASNEWILSVDADELVPRKLRDRLIEIMMSNQYDAVLIPHKNYFFGRAMQGTGWGPLQDMHVRFYRKEMMCYSDNIHNFAHLDPSARIYKLVDESCAFIHFNYIDAEHFIEKLNRYTTIEAKSAFAADKSVSLTKLVYAIIKEIGVRFFLKKGYKDGFQGFALVLLMVTYRLSVTLKLYILSQFQSTNPRNIIFEKYDEIAKENIQEYRYSGD